MTKLTSIPGIGHTFQKDFGRIGIETVEQLANAAAEQLFEQLCTSKAQEDDGTSKNYLYVIRMAIFYANGGLQLDARCLNAGYLSGCWSGANALRFR